MRPLLSSQVVHKYTIIIWMSSTGNPVIPPGTEETISPVSPRIVDRYAPHGIPNYQRTLFIASTTVRQVADSKAIDQPQDSGGVFPELSPFPFFIGQAQFPPEIGKTNQALLAAH